MRFCVHRGTKEIGGTCVEIEAQGKRIVLDVGVPLDVADPDAMPLHPVQGFDQPDASLLGVIISHPHQDHYGLAYRLPEETTFLIGEAAKSILEAAGDFTPAGLKVEHAVNLENRRDIRLGPFTITPYLVDHSAYDSYAVLVEADGKRLFYSGDFRAHGRKSKLVDQLIAKPPKDVDVLLMEGTTLGRPETETGFPTEEDLVDRFVDLFQHTDGLVLVWTSGQNIDRIVTLYKACRRAQRQLILDPYTLHMVRATGNERIPREGWTAIRVFAPFYQRLHIKRDERFDLITPFKQYRIYSEQLPDAAASSVMLFRPSMIGDLDHIDGLRPGRFIHSMWSGYLEEERSPRLLRWLALRETPIAHCHTSGHADLVTLRRLREAFREAIVVPIHTERADSYPAQFGGVQPLRDGQWWTA
ncbi:MAG: MBL fold metallo-hydrolase [Planctomycetota bacterium]|jgi:ribonuclease J